MGRFAFVPFALAAALLVGDTCDETDPPLCPDGGVFKCQDIGCACAPALWSRAPVGPDAPEMAPGAAL